jgi:hypothetical protein
MSGKATGMVWELDLKNAKQLVLLAMADHADHDGENIWPSLNKIAWKTGYTERHVRRTVGELVKDGILVPVEIRAGKSTVYKIDFDVAPRKTPLKKEKTGQENGSNVTPDTGVTPDIAMSPPPLTQLCPGTPDTAMSPKRPLTSIERKEKDSATADAVAPHIGYESKTATRPTTYAEAMNDAIMTAFTWTWKGTTANEQGKVLKASEQLREASVSVHLVPALYQECEDRVRRGAWKEFGPNALCNVVSDVRAKIKRGQSTNGMANAEAYQDISALPDRAQVEPATIDFDEARRAIAPRRKASGQ